MNGGNEVSPLPNVDVQKTNGPTVIETNTNGKTGQDKCPKCGATDISLNMKSGMLRCNYCRHEFLADKLEGLTSDISSLKGEVLASSASDITSAEDMVTLKCESCGAEVVIDTASSTQSRCHWCRNMLSLNQKVANGAVPDVVLPFKLEKILAKNFIEAFVKKRSFFANSKFKSEFNTDNIMGVYLPYLIVDVNSHATFNGYGEHLTRSYLVGHNDHKTRMYDADLYRVTRDYDLIINGLTIESSSDKLNNSSNEKTNNVINAIMPFDIENCVKFNSNYLKGFTSEKRDTNIEDVKPILNKQAKDIARFSANDTLKFYDRGVKWDTENLNIIGQQFKTAYLPVWLYSYQEKKGDKSNLHYVAVNARTNETMGSVPINIPKLIGVSCLVELFGFILLLFVNFDYDFLFLTSGVIFYVVNYLRYRNSDERHKYESETNKSIANLISTDDFVQHNRRMKNSKINGANNNKIEGSTVPESFATNFANNNEVISQIKNSVNNEGDKK